MARPKSRTARWYEAIADARAAAETLQNEWANLSDVQQEYQEWLDNLPENLGQSALGEKLQAVTDLDLDEGVVQEAIDRLDEAEGMDMPLGFGRD